MLKIQIQKDKINISLTSNSSKIIPKKKLQEFITSATNLIYENEVAENPLKEFTDQLIATEPEHHSSNFVRGVDRLPNPVSINGVLVDPSNTEVIHPEKRSYRCPGCGQSNHFIIYSKSDDSYMTFVKRDDESKDYDVVTTWTKSETENMSQQEKDKMFYCQSELTFNDFINSIKKLPIQKGVDLVINEDESEAECIMCSHKSSMVTWNKAYVSPEEFFESFPICDDCGGEIELITKETINGPEKIKKCIKCEKEFTVCQEE